MDVILLAISAKLIHKTLAPFCLKAYCDKHSTANTTVLEYSINDNTLDIVSEIYRHNPDVVGFSCYIWNISQTIKVASIIHTLLPSCVIVLGGPEVSFEQDISNFPFANYIIKGAGEVAFCSLIKALQTSTKMEQIISMDTDFVTLPSPFTDEYFASFTNGRMLDIKNQLVYYESTRGCPFSCSYCLSSATSNVSSIPIERVKDELLLLISKGATCIKFVDRTFNANNARAFNLLSFIKSLDTTCTFHFEVAADLFSEELLCLIESMQVGRIQLEIGIQSVNECTLQAVNRTTNIPLVLSIIKRLSACNNAHIHIDLIAGLPFDTLKSFSQSINQCIAIRPHKLQLGFLKMLKGCQIRENAAQYGYKYTSNAPYEVLQNEFISFNDIIILKSIEAVIDKFYNSGMYKNTINYAITSLFNSAYDFFIAISQYCSDTVKAKSTLKMSYTILYNFLLLYSTKEIAEHYIKLDCLSYDAKCMLPDTIQYYRDKAMEKNVKQTYGYNNVRVEYFPLEYNTKAFIYDIKNPITNEYMILEV